MPNHILTHLYNSGYLAKPTDFQVEFTPPSYVNLQNNDRRRLLLNCSASSLPDINLQTIDNDSGGAKNSKIIHSMETTPINLTFYGSEDMLEKRVFDSWIGGMFTPYYNNVRYDNEITSDFIIRKLSRKGYTRGERIFIGEWVLIEAKPISISTTQLSYSATDSLMEINIQLEYHDYYFNKL